MKTIFLFIWSGFSLRNLFRLVAKYFSSIFPRWNSRHPSRQDSKCILRRERVQWKKDGVRRKDRKKDRKKGLSLEIFLFNFTLLTLEGIFFIFLRRFKKIILIEWPFLLASESLNSYLRWRKYKYRKLGSIRIKLSLVKQTKILSKFFFYD